MGLPLAVLMGLFGALFPERLRQRTGIESNLPIALFTWITGLLQLAAGAVLMWLYFAAHNGSRGLTADGIGLPGLEVVSASSRALWALTLYLCAEGAVRTLAGLVGSSCGIFPLWVVDRLLALGVDRTRAALTPRAIRDVVERPGGEVAYRVGSCRDYGWTDLTTVELRGEWYRVLAQRHDTPGERPHVYLLGALTPGWVSRGAVVRYDPYAVVRAEAHAPGAAPSVAEVGRALVDLAPPRTELLGGLAAVLVSPLVCLLPERTRDRLHLTGLWLAPFTFATGLLELAAGLILAAPRFRTFDVGLLVGLLLTAEGVVRTCAGFAGIDCGLFGAWVVERAVVGARGAHHAATTPALVVDAVRVLGDRIEVRSCRARDFGPSITVEYEGAAYHVVETHTEPSGLRPYVYVLEPTPPTWIDRGRITYRPDAVINGGR